MYETVLVPTDGSPIADSAGAYAIRLAERFDATIHVVHVAERALIGGADDGEQAVDDLADRAAARDLEVTTAIRDPEGDVYRVTHRVRRDRSRRSDRHRNPRSRRSRSVPPRQCRPANATGVARSGRDGPRGDEPRGRPRATRGADRREPQRGDRPRARDRGARTGVGQSVAIEVPILNLHEGGHQQCEHRRSDPDLSPVDERERLDVEQELSGRGVEHEQLQHDRDADRGDEPVVREESEPVSEPNRLNTDDLEYDEPGEHHRLGELSADLVAGTPAQHCSRHVIARNQLAVEVERKQREQTDRHEDRDADDRGDDPVGDNTLVGRPRLPFHHVVGRGVDTHRERGNPVGDDVDPEHLNRRDHESESGERPRKDHRHLAAVAR
ncbi:UspA domain-containing protein [Natronorubrum sulfidifaciens JCM 14089]|uniref:UspA domain-containing protein n=1 Tax=Natronorubrum sulfidifaciens JCM 14089 TaxID=1230460 RepID=L9W5I1_9EURY|nr:UspA domain-containing protein [Natronorubrum sulfidifaciens JCM 14089]